MGIRKNKVNTFQTSEQIKICIVYPVPFPTVGGFENLVYELVAALSKKVIVTVICPGLRSQKDIPEDVNVYPILKTFKTRYIGFLLSSFLNFIAVYNFLRREKPDVIHAHPVFPSGFLALPAKILDIPIICTSHGGDIQVNRDIGYGARRNKIIAKLIKLTLRCSSLHTVLNKTMIKDAIEAGSHLSKIRVVYNGIDLDKIPSLVGSEILQRYKITKDNFIVLYLGRFHPKKCPDDLVKAFPKVIEKVPNAKLIFTGMGEEEAKLKRFVSDLNLEEEVVFTGPAWGNDKWSLLKNCDVFVLPSVVEGHPIAVIDAMACEKPVIATNLGPFPEIIKDGETGLLVPLHAPDDLADAIIELALDEVKRKEMGKMARKDVEERFDINKIADVYLRIYEELVGTKKDVRAK